MNATKNNTIDLNAHNVVQNNKSQPVCTIASATPNTIERLAAAREAWQANAMRTSNEQLYALLQDCYMLYKQMEDKDANATALREQLNEFIASKSYTFKKTTHTIAKLIKCVFGVENRSRISVYTTVLRSALTQNIKPSEISQFISNAGGIEEIRLAKSPNAMTHKQKAQVASQALAEQTLAVVSSEAVAELLDAGKIGTNTVLVGTWQADGSIVIRAVVNSDTALNAALASQYSATKTIEKTKAAETSATAISKKKQKAIANAVATATITTPLANSTQLKTFNPQQQFTNFKVNYKPVINKCFA